MCVCVSECVLSEGVHCPRLLDDNILCKPLDKVHVEEVRHQGKHRLLGRPTMPQTRLLTAHVGEAIQR